MESTEKHGKRPFKQCELLLMPLVASKRLKKHNIQNSGVEQDLKSSSLRTFPVLEAAMKASKGRKQPVVLPCHDTCDPQQ